ncbi:Unknown protein sequence [Pseudomonas syringae pv. cilantro]|uniref:Uncharacterized protein n=2 Tax=Pseudomonas syringae group TaxID=136849 RepID=A0A0N0GGE0_PSESX|nr:MULTISPECIES: hypothetical protein [Pseudomonas syringae group]KPC33158.1 Unknown protein sequence [Pseudomonas syringae pv. cilantro]KPW71469.1 hypothetical protein ALO76_101983 [Pseudomonas syringae pv. coriandricola]RMN08192.1 hypothetical protein ALQ65_101854 [Pseudomonas syringae pv. coriandricola]
MQKAENNFFSAMSRAQARQPSRIKPYSTSQGESRDIEKLILFRNRRNQGKKIS